MRLGPGRRTNDPVVLTLTAGAAGVFFGFAVARAVLVPLTYDEASAYIRYLTTDGWSLFNFADATNHFLNTALTKVAYLIGGDREIVLRAPNLAGYALYLMFSWLICRRMEHRVVAIAGFLLLNLNPYVMDFFALSRGYGLSLGLLMGALHFFLAFLSDVGGDAAGRRLARAFLFLVLAVMANFTLLDVAIGVFLVAAAAFVIVNRRVRRPATAVAAVAAQPPVPARTVRWPWLPPVAALFTLLVLSQHPDLSGGFYDSVIVKVSGLDASELTDAEAWHVDRPGHPTRFDHHAGTSVWNVARGTQVASIRVAMPAAAADRVADRSAAIEVVIGERVFRSDRPGGEWRVREGGAIPVLESGPALASPRSRMPRFQMMINWRGDTRYVMVLVFYTAVALAMLGVLAVVLKAAGHLAVRRRLLQEGQWRVLATGALWIVALTAAPLYVLMGEDALYYGGTLGLVHDTFYSLIESSLYGSAYHAAQNQVVFAAVLVTVAAFGALLIAGYRRGTSMRFVPGAALLAIILIAVIVELGEAAAFGTPYRLNRTALFFVPVYTLFTIFLLDRLAGVGQIGRLLAIGALGVVVPMATWHFVRTANVTYAHDWRPDASTKTMISEVAHLASADRPADAHVALGVDWVFGPAAIYYARRESSVIIDVLPVEHGRDFVYLEDRGPDRMLDVITRYPVARSVLGRVKR